MVTLARQEESGWHCWARSFDFVASADVKQSNGSRIAGSCHRPAPDVESRVPPRAIWEYTERLNEDARVDRLRTIRLT